MSKRKKSPQPRKPAPGSQRWNDWCVTAARRNKAIRAIRDEAKDRISMLMESN